ncbi:MAG TPA: transglycosylase SLT domain-containing protein [Stellaceae bacterium]|nr:transglycosylase SLT domain-containing protein [Stellaceae bacterium]
MRRGFLAAPRPVRIAALASALLIVFALANFAYQIARKPTEMLFPLSGGLDKTPAQSWRQYGELFRQYSTALISPELLAALAQIEGAGNPMARTYWRWRLTFHPFAIYAPASSAVGMYQMTDPTFAEARHYCIREHAVVTDCWFSSLYNRLVPSNAIELAAALLDRDSTAILERRHGAPPTKQQRQDLAAIIHLCGAGTAEAFARRGFRLAPGERCGDHDAAAYVAKVDAMVRQFARLAAEK